MSDPHRLEQAREQVARLELELKSPRIRRMRISDVVFLVLVIVLPISLCLGSGWALASATSMGWGPLSAAHAQLFCPRVCEGCGGPYRIASWNTTGPGRRGVGVSVTPHTRVYCSDSEGRVAGMSSREVQWSAESNGPWLDQYRFAGGIWIIWASVVVGLVPIVGFALLTLLLFTRRNRPKRRAAIQAKLDAAQARLR